MKKTVSPKIVTVIIIVVVLLAAFLFYQKAQTKRTAAISRGGITIQDGKRVEPPAGRGRGQRGGGARGQ